MNLSEYQDWATTTAVYPTTHGDWKRNPFYVGLGLIGEAHKFEQEMMKPPSDRQAKELSDVLWYASMLAWEFGERIEDLLYAGRDVLAGMVGPSDLIGYSQEGLHDIASRTCEPLKKLWRDDDQRQYTKLMDALSATIACIDETAIIIGVGDIEALADISHAKLSVRKAAGTLHGNGSDR